MVREWLAIGNFIDNKLKKLAEIWTRPYKTVLQRKNCFKPVNVRVV